MKKTFYNIFALLAVTSLIFLADACLKDDRFVDFSNVGPVIEFPDAQPGKAVGLTLELSDTPDTVWVRINQTGPSATDHDLLINLGVSQAGLDLYNLDTAHVVGTLLPDSAFVIPASATIVAGKDPATNINNLGAKAMVLIYSKKIPITPGVNYVLPIGIISAPAGFTVSGNYGAILYNFYHNPYDGDYSSKITRYNFSVAGDYAGWDQGLDQPAAGSVIASQSTLTFPFTILTVNATTSTVHAGNDAAAFGTMDLKVDPNTNLVTIISTPDTGLNALIPLQGPGAPPSTWDPVAKKFNLYYQYTNTSGTFRVLHDVLTHL